MRLWSFLLFAASVVLARNDDDKDRFAISLTEVSRIGYSQETQALIREAVVAKEVMDKAEQERDLAEEKRREALGRYRIARGIRNMISKRLDATRSRLPGLYAAAKEGRRQLHKARKCIEKHESLVDKHEEKLTKKLLPKLDKYLDRVRYLRRLKAVAEKRKERLAGKKGGVSAQYDRAECEGSIAEGLNAAGTTTAAAAAATPADAGKPNTAVAGAVGTVFLDAGDSDSDVLLAREELKTMKAKIVGHGSSAAAAAVTSRKGKGFSLVSENDADAVALKVHVVPNAELNKAAQDAANEAAKEEVRKAVAAKEQARAEREAEKEKQRARTIEAMEGRARQEVKDDAQRRLEADARGRANEQLTDAQKKKVDDQIRGIEEARRLEEQRREKRRKCAKLRDRFASLDERQKKADAQVEELTTKITNKTNSIDKLQVSKGKVTQRLRAYRLTLGTCRTTHKRRAERFKVVLRRLSEVRRKVRRLTYQLRLANRRYNKALLDEQHAREFLAQAKALADAAIEDYNLKRKNASEAMDAYHDRDIADGRSTARTQSADEDGVWAIRGPDQRHVRAVSVGKWDEVYALTGGRTIEHFSREGKNKHWLGVPGAGQAIGVKVDCDGTLWKLSADGAVFNMTDKNEWTELPVKNGPKLKAFSIANPSEIWGISADAASAVVRYDPLAKEFVPLQKEEIVSLPEKPVGCATGALPNTAFHASSVRDNNKDAFAPWYGRLHNDFRSKGKETSGGAWCAHGGPGTAKGQWLMVDFGARATLAGVALQGRGKYSAQTLPVSPPEWISSFRLQYAASATATPLEPYGCAAGGAIPDTAFTASTFYRHDPQFAPAKARLGKPSSPASASAWVPDTDTDPAGQWVQVDLGTVGPVAAVATQGRRRVTDAENDDEFATATFSLQFAERENEFVDYVEDGVVKIFEGNDDGTTVRNNVLLERVMARWVRFVVRSSHTQAALRFEVYKATTGTDNQGRVTWIDYTEGGSVRVFDNSNVKSTEAVSNFVLQEPVRARYVRLLVEDAHNAACARVEFYRSFSLPVPKVGMRDVEVRCDGDLWALSADDSTRELLHFHRPGTSKYTHHFNWKLHDYVDVTNTWVLKGRQIAEVSLGAKGTFAVATNGVLLDYRPRNELLEETRNDDVPRWFRYRQTLAGVAAGIDGSLFGISVGDRDLVQYEVAVPEANFISVSRACDKSTVAVTTAGKLVRWNQETQKFQSPNVDVTLSRVANCGGDEIYGINWEGTEILEWWAAGSRWIRLDLVPIKQWAKDAQGRLVRPVLPKLTKIECGCYGALAVGDSAGNLYYRLHGGNTKFEPVAKGIKDFSVGDELYVVDDSNRAYRFPLLPRVGRYGPGTRWEPLHIGLKAISADGSGGLYGVTLYGEAVKFVRVRHLPGWVIMDGQVREVRVGGYGSVFGLSPAGALLFRTEHDGEPAWTLVKGAPVFSQLSVGCDGSLVGVTKPGEVMYLEGGASQLQVINADGEVSATWVKLADDETDEATVIEQVTAEDSAHIWGLSKEGLLHLYHTSEHRWMELAGQAMKQISVACDGDLYGIDLETSTLWKRPLSTGGWERLVDHKVTAIAAGDDVFAMDEDHLLYKYVPNSRVGQWISLSTTKVYSISAGRDGAAYAVDLYDRPIEIHEGEEPKEENDDGTPRPDSNGAPAASSTTSQEDNGDGIGLQPSPSEVKAESDRQKDKDDREVFNFNRP